MIEENIYLRFKNTKKKDYLFTSEVHRFRIFIKFTPVYNFLEK